MFMMLSATHAFNCIVLRVKFGQTSCEDISLALSKLLMSLLQSSIVAIFLSILYSIGFFLKTSTDKNGKQLSSVVQSNEWTRLRIIRTMMLFKTVSYTT